MDKIKIENYDEYCNIKEKPFIIPQIKSPFRMIMSSKSAGGKTNLLCNLLLQPLLYYERLIIFSTTLHQPKYQFLIEFFDSLYKDELKKHDTLIKGKKTIKNMIKQKITEGDVEKYLFNKEKAEPVERIATFYEDMEKLPSFEEIGDKYHTLVVVDDCVLEKNQTKMTQFFVKGRHKKISIIYQTQKFTALPKIMREQASHYIFLGKQDDILLRSIAMSVPLGLGYTSLKNLFHNYIRNNFDNILFDVECPDSNKTIFRNLDEAIPMDDVRIT